MELSFGFKGMNFRFAYLRNMFGKVSFVDSLDISPVILDIDFSEFSFVLIMPSPETSSLLFGEGSGAGDCVFATVSHLDIERNVSFVGYFSVSFDYQEVFLIFMD